ncbi:MAG: hypothetical protein NTV79_02170 [Candidatus Aureabacteria bacterium]|nr:hypothetical protein [Candidatus Auribacterota bacterium]
MGACAIAVYRPSEGLWAIRGLTRAHFGTWTDTLSDYPVPFDYDGDHTAEPGIFREMTGLWAFRGVTRFYYGKSGDQPVIGRFETGSVNPAIAVYRSGEWAVRNVTRFALGGPDYAPVMIAHGPVIPMLEPSTLYTVFDPLAGLWIQKGLGRFFFGTAGDVPASGAEKIQR